MSYDLRWEFLLYFAIHMRIYIFFVQFVISYKVNNQIQLFVCVRAINCSNSSTKQNHLSIFFKVKYKVNRIICEREKTKIKMEDLQKSLKSPHVCLNIRFEAKIAHETTKNHVILHTQIKNI